MSDLESQIAKAEITKLNLQMEVMLKHNLDCFEKYAPSIADAFRNHEAEELNIYYDSEGYLNLYNVADQQPVYPMDPGVFVSKQLDIFKKKPNLYKFAFNSSSDDLGQIHAKYADKLVSYYDNGEFSKAPNTGIPEQVRFMLMLGCGVGFQIQDILKQTDLKHLAIYEPHMDAFYASLHLMDWEDVLKHFSRLGYSIQFYIGMEPSDAMVQLGEMLKREGYFNAVDTFFYKHFDSPKIKSMLDLFLREFHLTIYGWGYFDDERISLAHTIVNHINKTPVLSRSKKSSQGLNIPVYIVANGPSLDECADKIKADRENIILISCGTAIGSLYKMGIKPDIHVELERTRPVYEWIDVGTDAEFRKGIKLVALNPVHPDVFSLFDDVYVALKPNDAGSAFMQGCLLPGHDSIMVNASNPTVANCAFSVALSLGFKELYFIGVDLSLKSSSERHSKYSVYSDIDSETESKIGYQYDDGANFYVKGNKQKQVLTTPIYDSARFSLEFLLKTNDACVFNASNGVNIEGAPAVNLADVKHESVEFDRKSALEDLFNEMFILNNFEVVSSLEDAQKYIDLIFDAFDDLRLLLNESFESKDEVYRILNNLHKYITQLNLSSRTRMCFYLLKGSITYVTSLVALVINNVSTDVEAVEEFKTLKGIVLEFVNEMEAEMKANPFALDDNVRNLVQSLK